MTLTRSLNIRKLQTFKEAFHAVREKKVLRATFYILYNTPEELEDFRKYWFGFILKGRNGITIEGPLAPRKQPWKATECLTPKYSL